MPYEFPKHVLKQNEILDPDNLTLELTPASEQLSGNLGATNFSGVGTSIDPLQAGEHAFSSYKYAYREGSNDFRVYGIGSSPGDAPTCPQAPIFYVRKSGWQTACVINYSYITEPTRFWLSGIGQHLWYCFFELLPMADGGKGRVPFPGHAYQYGDVLQDEEWPSPRTTGLTQYPRKAYGAMVQWALRVNGSIIDDSITGSHDDQQQGIVPIQLKTQRLADEERVQFPGPSGEKTPQRASLGTVAWPCRLGTIVDVSPGNCVIELVVRRLDDDRYSKQYGNRPEENAVGIMNASINAIALPTRIGSPASSGTVGVPAFDDQVPFYPGSKVSRLANQFSHLRDSSIAPGTFRPDHMIGGPVVTFDQTSFHARTQLGYSGFSYHNRRPDMEWIPRMNDDGTSTSNPNKPTITWDHTTTGLTLPATATMYGTAKKSDTSGWCMWAVRSHNERRLDRFDALLTDHDNSSISPEVTSTGSNRGFAEIVPNFSKEWRELNNSFCVLRNKFPFKRNRKRGLLITADVQVNLLHGSRVAFDLSTGSTGFTGGSENGAGGYGDWYVDPFGENPSASGEWGSTPEGGAAYTTSKPSSCHPFLPISKSSGSGSGGSFKDTEHQQTKRAYSNAGVFGFFRLGYHIEGRDDDDWVILQRSEVFVNQFNNWREHPTLETDDEFRDTRPIANQANLSLQVFVDRPWLEERYWDFAPGGADENASILEVLQKKSQNMVIDGVALFVAGAETNTFYGPAVGLSGANLSAMLIDFGYTDSHAGFEGVTSSTGTTTAESLVVFTAVGSAE